MKILILFFGLLLNVSEAIQEESIIREKLQKQIDCWNRGDLDGFMADYWKSEQLLFIGKSGLTYGWEKTLNNYKKNYPSSKEMGVLNLEIREIKRLSDNHYFTVGQWHLKREVGDLSGHFSLLWEKMNNKWVIIVDHSS